MKSISVAISLQNDRTPNLDAIWMGMFLLTDTVRTEVALETRVLVICQIPLFYLPVF